MTTVEDPGSVQETTYDDLVIGDEIGRTRCVTDEARVARYRSAMPGSSDPTSVPLLLLATMHAMKTLLRVPDGTVHAEDTIELHRPVAVGEQLDTVLSVADKFLRGDKRFVVLRQEVVDPEGSVVLTALRRLAWAS